jgi:D-alanine transaminase
VQAIVALDAKPVGSGRPGPMFSKMYGWYQDYKERVMRAPAAA